MGFVLFSNDVHGDSEIKILVGDIGVRFCF